MKKELKYMIIKYTEKDLEYIDLFTEKLDIISEDIVKFFNIENFGKKIYVTLNDNLESFRKKYIDIGYDLEDDGTVPKWVCGFAFNDFVETLCLSEYRKTKHHENLEAESLLYLILHEFTHACHNKVMIDQEKNYLWLSEGLATTLSHQHDSSDLVFNATLDEMKDEITDYRNYHTMFKYVLDTYGREYILKLVKDYDLLVRHTPLLFKEVYDTYNKSKPKSK